MQVAGNVDTVVSVGYVGGNFNLTITSSRAARTSREANPVALDELLTDVKARMTAVEQATDPSLPEPQGVKCRPCKGGVLLWLDIVVPSGGAGRAGRCRGLLPPAPRRETHLRWLGPGW